ncbi:hypothetical protein AMTR_s00031p00242430 [Amborella trichopoda]|uniref:Aminotransferase-like plant mobile domain-containing protein n=1 Tax=Amborella trichopoda TaxID=13333 RepID=U5CTL0_AMBTC|nr:hypothetical protein AMTR_s00031p00242430 [Amborella trichopoda]
MSTIIERWCIETNTGHFNIDVGEMMPTLEDTLKILWSKVTGVAVTLRRVENYGDYIVRIIGHLPPGRNHSIIRLTWLRNTFKQLFEDMEVIDQYAWGAATLAFLFRDLSKVVHPGYQHLSGSTTLLLLRDISHVAQLVRESYNSRTWDLVRKALDLLKIYDPEAVGDEDASEELELDDEMEDNVPPVWLLSRPDEGPSNTEPITTPAQPEEPKWQLRHRVARQEESSSNTKLQLSQWGEKLPV